MEKKGVSETVRVTEEISNLIFLADVLETLLHAPELILHKMMNSRKDKRELRKYCF